MRRTIQLYSLREGPFESHLSLSASELERFREWFKQLPKVLWEIGVGNPVLTEVCQCHHVLFPELSSTDDSAVILAHHSTSRCTR